MPEHVRRNRRAGKFGSMRGGGSDGATHDMGGAEARERPSLGTDEYRHAFMPTDAALAQQSVDGRDEIAR